MRTLYTLVCQAITVFCATLAHLEERTGWPNIGRAHLARWIGYGAKSSKYLCLISIADMYQYQQSHSDINWLQWYLNCCYLIMSIYSLFLRISSQVPGFNQGVRWSCTGCQGTVVRAWQVRSRLTSIHTQIEFYQGPRSSHSAQNVVHWRASDCQSSTFQPSR